MLSKAITILPGVLCAMLLSATEASAQCEAPTCTKLINNGADAGKKVVVVMGDGYTAADQAAYNTQVNDLVTNGVFGNDFFREQHNAFNVYRLNLQSTDSGVSQIDYDEQGTSSDPATTPSSARRAGTRRCATSTPAPGRTAGCSTPTSSASI
jgi:hypothetical protein